MDRQTAIANLGRFASARQIDHYMSSNACYECMDEGRQAIIAPVNTPISLFFEAKKYKSEFVGGYVFGSNV